MVVQILDHNLKKRMKSGEPLSLRGPSSAEVRGWLNLPSGTHGHWVDRGLVADADPMSRGEVVELFVVSLLKDALRPRELLHAWARISDRVLRLKAAPSRLDLVWIAAPPSAHILRSDQELAHLARRKPRRLIVVPLADAIAEAHQAFDQYMDVAWKTQSRGKSAKARKANAPRRRGRPRRPLSTIPVM